MARKPLIGTVAANHAAHGTGVLNIDACRIAGPKASGSGTPPLQFGGENHRPFHDNPTPREFDTTQGRWPANVALDDEAARLLDEQSGHLQSGVATKVYEPTLETSVALGNKRRTLSPDMTIGDAGGASRFFYCAKASRGEREAGLREAGRGDGRTAPSDRPYLRDSARFNHHPTVKPVDLMRWLVRLVTPVGGTVLDPFLGSGTTGIAAIEEGCDFIGIEREAAYVEIATRRLAAAARQGRLFNG